VVEREVRGDDIDRLVGVDFGLAELAVRELDVREAALVGLAASLFHHSFTDVAGEHALGVGRERQRDGAGAGPQIENHVVGVRVGVVDDEARAGVVLVALRVVVLGRLLGARGVLLNRLLHTCHVGPPAL